jgi:hypothetical protein
LSLVFVPSFYVVMDDLARLTKWTFMRFAGARDEAAFVDPEIEKLRLEQSKTSDAVGALQEKLMAVHDRIEDVAASVSKKPKLKVAAE